MFAYNRCPLMQDPSRAGLIVACLVIFVQLFFFSICSMMSLTVSTCVAVFFILMAIFCNYFKTCNLQLQLIFFYKILTGGVEEAVDCKPPPSRY